jgi:hypothetical protein
MRERTPQLLVVDGAGEKEEEVIKAEHLPRSNALLRTLID